MKGRVLNCYPKMSGATPAVAALSVAARLGWLDGIDGGMVSLPDSENAPQQLIPQRLSRAAGAGVPARALIAALSQDTVYTEASNVETNRKLWDAYATDWAADKVRGVPTTVVGCASL